MIARTVGRSAERRGRMLTVEAPLRISFGGGGTDLPAYYERHGGLVVSAAISRYARVTIAPAPDGRIHLTSLDYRRRESFDPGAIPAPVGPLALLRAAVGWFAGDGRLDDGFEIRTSSAVPPGTGLGSSSAMAVALVRALADYFDLSLGAAAIAEAACALEIDRLNMPIGKQDQYASANGGINTISFQRWGVRVDPLELSEGVIDRLEERLLLFSTGRSRHSSAILQQQQQDSRSNSQVVEALHHIKDLAGQMRSALTASEIDRFGSLLDVAWQEKRRLSRRISNGEIDRWYATARAAGALGGKITGAGGGGFLLIYCPPERQPALRSAMARSGLRELPFGFDFHGARVNPDGRPANALVPA